MTKIEAAANIIQFMRNEESVIHNYIAPGLDSYLLNKNDCKTRLFHMTKDQEFYISPHNHRFHFACCVLGGEVRHFTYHATSDLCSTFENVPRKEYESTYQVNTYRTEGFGKGFSVETNGYQNFRRIENLYLAGDWYCLNKDTFHAINFSKGALVLFLEAPNQEETSQFLEPIVNGKVIPLFSVPDWMYKA